MEEFSVRPYELDSIKVKRQRKIFIGLGIIWASQSLFYFTENKNGLGWMYFVAAFIFVIGTIIDLRNKKQYHLIFNEEGIDSNISYFNKSKIRWEQIKSVTITVLTITLELKKSKSEDIDLSQFGYNDVKLIKDKMIEWTKYKNIEIK
jgi:hypothetical protein